MVGLKKVRDNINGYTGRRDISEQEISLTHYHTMPHFEALKIYSCVKHCEKRRNCL